MTANVAHIMNLTRWEWYKLRRRWMPWVMLAVLLVVSQLFVWVSYSINRSEQSADVYANFTLPGSIANVLGFAHGIGVFLVVILTASTLGTEYRWRTLHSILARGTGRWQYLASKVLLLVLVAGAALLVVTATTAISSLIAGALAGDAPPGSSDSPQWIDVPVVFGKAWFSFLPYIALATFFTVLTTSSAAGMAISLVYYYAESIVVAIFLNLFTWFETVASYMLGRNVTALMRSGDDTMVLNFVIGGGFGSFPGALHAFLVLAVYVLAMVGLAIWLFRRRDLTGN
jgi:ABC-2 type transport system permease protein